MRASILVVLCIVCSLNAGAVGGIQNGGQAGEFLYFGTSIRSLGLGRAYVGLTDDATSVFHNPAGLMRAREKVGSYYQYSNLFHESVYNSIAVTLSHPLDTLLRDKWIFGRHNPAIGIGFISLESGRYEIRDENDFYYGDFGLAQRALFFSLANRLIGKMAVLDYGLSAKYVWYSSSDILIDPGEIESRQPFGLDLGFQLQFVNFRLISLRRILPLRIGGVVQNIIPTRVGYGSRGDIIPRIYRLGVSYVKRMSSTSDLVTAFDIAKICWPGSQLSFHGGIEYRFYSMGITIAPRLGGYYQSKTPTLTCGLGLTVAKGIVIQTDIAQGIEFFDRVKRGIGIGHGAESNLPCDLRISMNISFGGERRSDYYLKRALQSDSGEIKRFIEVLANYPLLDRFGPPWGDVTPATQAADTLALRDTDNSGRYEDFSGGLPKASRLVRQARDSLRHGLRDVARKLAVEADSIFSDKAVNSPIIWRHRDSLACGEARLIKMLLDTLPSHDAGMLDSVQALCNYLDGIQGSPIALFLAGASYQFKVQYEGDNGTARINDLKTAQARFDSVRTYSDAGNSLWLTAAFNEVECIRELVDGKAGRLNYDADFMKELAQQLAARVVDLRCPLQSTYYPYPVRQDTNVAGWVWYFVGVLREYLLSSGTEIIDSVITSYGRVCRIYPESEACRQSDVLERLNRLINRRLREIETNGVGPHAYGGQGGYNEITAGVIGDRRLARYRAVHLAGAPWM